MTATPDSAPDYTLRPARPEDADFLFSVFVASRERELSVLPLPPEQAAAFARQQYRAHLMGQETEFPDAVELIVEMPGEDGRPVPTGRLVRAERPGEVWICDLAVMPDRRNAGLGAALLRAAMDEVTARGLILRGSVTPYNPARRLYARLGVVELPGQGAYIPLEWRPEPGAAVS